MSGLARRLLAGVGAAEKLYVDDVFSTWLYTGNGATQTINNGIDLAGNGGLVWTKGRNTTSNHALIDTLMGVDKVHYTNMTNAAGAVPPLTALSTGYATPNLNWSDANESGISYVSWTFRKAPKFFDVVTYTGSGTSSRDIAHSLGVIPGMIIVKAANQVNDWVVYARKDSTNYSKLYLQTTGLGSDVSIAANASLNTFKVGGGQWLQNANGISYVAYLFAHDPSADGIIQCGSFTTDGSGNATVNLGWEPQYINFKRVDSTSNWFIRDSMRGWVTDTGTGSQHLYANTSDAEATGAALSPTATGFRIVGFAAGYVGIYLAIRRPNKPPTTGTQVFSATTYVATNTDNRLVDTGIVTDSVFAKIRGSGSAGYDFASGNRLTGNAVLMPSRTIAETMDSDALMTPTVGFGNAFSAMNGFGCGNNNDSSSGVFNLLVGGVGNYVAYAFRRAPGFFDVVCYTGTGATHTESHNLGAVPEIIIVKGRSAATQWVVYSSALGATKYLSLNSTAAEDIFSGFWDNVTPTSSVFTVGTGGAVNQNSQTHVAYLFATKVGISKVGNYTGNGGTQTIACGFTTGARFILIKRTESTGDWYVWDTARGIVSANDPHLSLNTTAAEVTTDDSVDPTNEGFIVNNVSPTNINVTGGSYIFLAIS